MKRILLAAIAACSMATAFGTSTQLSDTLSRRAQFTGKGLLGIGRACVNEVTETAQDAFDQARIDLSEVRSGRSFGQVAASGWKMLTNTPEALAAASTTVFGSYLFDTLFQTSSRRRKRGWINLMAYLSAFHGAQCQHYNVAVNRSYVIGVSVFALALATRLLANMGKPKRDPKTGKKKPNFIRLVKWAMEDAVVVGVPYRLAKLLADLTSGIERREERPGPPAAGPIRAAAPNGIF